MLINLYANQLRLKSTELGIGLALIGVPLGMYLNYFFSVNFISELIMFLCILFIPEKRIIYSLKVMKLGWVINLILVLNIMYLFYSIYSGIYDYIPMHLFILFFIFSFYFSDMNNFDLNYLIKVLFLFSSICTLMGAYFIFSGKVVGDEAWEIRQNNENFALEVFTISYGAVINLTTSLYLLISKKNKKYLMFLLILLDLYIIVFGGKRSPLLCVGVIFLIWFNYFKYIVKLKDVLFLIFLFFLIFIFLNFNDFFSSQLISVLESLYLGFLVLLGFEGVYDQTGSATFRVGLRDFAFNLINSDFELKNYIFGYGYMTQWLDNPVLQSFLDMGLMGFSLYIFVVIFYPIFKYINFIKNSEVTLFFTYCLYAILTSFNSGHQYMSIKYIPVIILIYVIFSIKKQNGNLK